MSREKLQDAWEAMTTFQRFTLSKVHTAIQHTTMDSLKAFAKRLEKQGMIKQVQSDDEQEYSVLKKNANPFEEVKQAVKHKSTGRHRMWQSMRILRDFDVNQLITTATVSESAARAYISSLKKANVLIVVKQAPRTGSLIERAGETTIYRLLKDLGPKHPVVKHNGIFDGNKGCLITYKKPVKRPVIMQKMQLGEVYSND